MFIIEHSIIGNFSDSQLLKKFFRYWDFQFQTTSSILNNLEPYVFESLKKTPNRQILKDHLFQVCNQEIFYLKRF